MKKIGEYTARGLITDRTTKRITLFDGRFDTGYKIISFKVLPDNPDEATADVVGTLATEAGAATVAWNLSDQRQIAWSGNKNDGYSSTHMGVIDPDNFIVEDLYFRGRNASAGSINYLITMEKYETTDWMGALALVRNAAQDVGS